MAAKKTKKSLQPQSAPTASKLNLVALKPLLKTPETQTSSPSSVEPSLPVETPTSVETPTHPDEIDPSLPENQDAIFQAIGIIAGEVAFSGKKTSITIADKQYPLFYSSTRKKAFEALKIHINSTGQSRQRLIVYPKVIHFPKPEQPYQIGFQFVGFVSDNVTQVEETTQRPSSTISNDFQDGEFKLSGLWQFVPICQTPCITVQKNFSDSRLKFIKEATLEQKVNFLKASHIPLIWKNPPVQPFRFNPELEKEQQGNASFVEIKATFLPLQDVFEFSSLCSRPSQKPPKSLKASKKDKAQALQAKNQRKQEKEKEKEKRSSRRPLGV